MSDPYFVDLKDIAPSSATVQFIRAEVPAYRSPFIRVFYAVRGQEEKFALRLDVDKRVFLDHLENPADDQFVRRVAPQIANLVSERVTDPT
jgi:hypothetical protein